MAADATTADITARAEGKDVAILCDKWDIADAINQRLHDHFTAADDWNGMKQSAVDDGAESAVVAGERADVGDFEAGVGQASLGSLAPGRLCQPGTHPTHRCDAAGRMAAAPACARLRSRCRSSRHRGPCAADRATR